jgi:hypothetical protein
VHEANNFIFSDGDQGWWLGEVMHVNVPTKSRGSGVTYTIKYEDGDLETKKEESSIRLASTEEAQGIMNNQEEGEPEGVGADEEMLSDSDKDKSYGGESKLNAFDLTESSEAIPET